MHVHILQHVSFEGPGSIGDWLLNHRHEVTYTHFHNPDYSLPDLRDIDALIIMGGPMGVYDDDRYAWLTEEKNFITSAISQGKRILGICLGAQLMAFCAGAAVSVAPYKEIGWFPIYPTAEAAGISWFNTLLAGSPIVFHWHGDRFGIPPGSGNLAYTNANDNQAFSLGEQMIGLQFHPEITPDGLRQMVAHGRDELHPAPYIQEENTILENVSFESARSLMRGILEHLFVETL
jgi:GMP synthase-like glutamine amidotransferase